MNVTIGKLAAAAAVSVDAVRFYQREGLLQPARKTRAGYRLYDAEAARRIRFIRQAQQCGFALAEIRALLELRARAGACCEDVRGVAVEKKLAIERKILALKAMSEALTALVERCNAGDAPLEACPILAAFDASAALPAQRTAAPPGLRAAGRPA